MKKPVRITSHLLYWIFTYLALPYLFLTTYFFSWLIVHRRHEHEKFDLDPFPGNLIMAVLGACIFYVSYYSLIYLLRRPSRFWWIVSFYLIANLIISLPATFVSEQAARMLAPVFYFNVCGFLFKALEEWIKDRKRNLELVKDREASQLELLKTKLDPHFLFNNLNNIDVFILESPSLASEYLKKLSDILRFMLYDANKTKIPLSEEIEYIRKYIDLQKIRTSNPDFVKLEINGETTGKQIPPMVLIHFIENAFKHAGNKKGEDAIMIRLEIFQHRLLFSSKNHVSSAQNPDNKKNGQGIDLLRKKLDLLYKKNYTLSTKEENKWYFVTLDIQLNED